MSRSHDDVDDERALDLREFLEVDSTQTTARELAMAGARHGTAVVAQRQRAARGRRGRQWRSAHVGVWCSVILRPRVPLVVAPRLPIAACAVVLDVLLARGIDAWIKWPNDLLIQANEPSERLGPFRKVGGLLVEVLEVDGGRLDTAVVGVGLNLCAPQGGFLGLEDTAGALEDVGVVDGLDAVGVEALRRAMARDVARALTRLDAVQMQAPGFTALIAGLRRRSATLGRRVVVDDVVGVAVELDDDGALVLEDEHGARRVITAGDVSLCAAMPSGSTVEA
jgi:BirA family biotin operon repressor/biotin-[acetyl-CoA-carboxylase] ligase